MSQGLQVFNESGIETLNSSKRIGRILGQVTTGGVDGSTTNADLPQGTMFAIPVVLTAGANFVEAYPSTYASGTTLSWVYPGGSGPNVILFYGVV